MLRRTTNEAGWFEQRIQVVFYRVKVRISADTVDEVVFEPELFDLVAGFVG